MTILSLSNSTVARLFETLIVVVVLVHGPAFGQSFDFSAAPLGSDNFLEASFRFVPAQAGEIPQAVLVFVPGTDGDARNLASDLGLLTACKSCHAALLICYFRGEGLPYDVPGGGSGEALENALSYFGQQTGVSQLTHVPILFLGYSQGAQFVINYICHSSHKVAAFAAIKPGSIALSPQESSFQIPGLIVAGANDEPGRIRTASRAFSWATGKGSKWAFLLERSSGHELDSVRNFALAFLTATWLSSERAPAVYANCETGSDLPFPSALPGSCFFPNQQIMQDWRKFHQHAALSSLISFPDRPRMPTAIQADISSDHLSCGNGEEEAATLYISATASHVQISHLSIDGKGFSLEEEQRTSLPRQVKVLFRPKDFPWGPVKASLTVEGEVSGRPADPMQINLTGTVQGPVVAIPSLVYLGVSLPGQEITRTIILRSAGTFQVRSMEVPSDVQVMLEPITSAAGETRLRMDWTPGNRYGTRAETIRIHIVSPQQAELDIPFLGVVSKPKD